MSMAPLLGIPGKLKTLAERLTATRAANLDDLDATISSRASATALATVDSEVGTILGRVPATVASQSSLNTVDANVDTLLTRVPAGSMGTSAISKTASIVVAGDGLDHLEVALGSAFDIAKTDIQVSSPYRVGSNPVGEPQFSHTGWAWKDASTIYLKFFDDVGADQNLISMFSIRVSAKEFK